MSKQAHEIDADEQIMAVMLIEITEPEHYKSPVELEAISNKMARVFGFENFDVGRERPNGNERRLAIRCLPPVGKAVFMGAEVDQRVQANAGWVGSENFYIAGRPSNQLLMVAIRTAIYNEHIQSGDWQMLAMLYAFIKDNGIVGKVWIGADHEAGYFDELTEEAFQRIQHIYLNTGNDDVAHTKDGKRIVTSHRQRLAEGHPHTVRCDCCSSSMEFQGFKQDVLELPIYLADGVTPMVWPSTGKQVVEEQRFATKKERHLCNACGERMYLDMSGEKPRAWWFGNSEFGVAPIEGAVSFVVAPVGAVEPVTEGPNYNLAPYSDYPASDIIARMRNRLSA